MAFQTVALPHQSSKTIMAVDICIFNFCSTKLALYFLYEKIVFKIITKAIIT